VSFEEDPEVVADLQLRAASERDSTRSRPSPALLEVWAPSSKFVGVWKCRTAPCMRMVSVTEETLEYFEKCNEWLALKGEQPLDPTTILRCDRCRDEVKARRPALLRQRVVEMAAVIGKLKASPQPRQEHDLIRQLTSWNHPDLPGLLDALDPRAGKSRKRGEL